MRGRETGVISGMIRASASRPRLLGANHLVLAFYSAHSPVMGSTAWRPPARGCSQTSPPSRRGRGNGAHSSWLRHCRRPPPRSCSTRSCSTSPRLPSRSPPCCGGRTRRRRRHTPSSPRRAGAGARHLLAPAPHASGLPGHPPRQATPRGHHIPAQGDGPLGALGVGARAPPVGWQGGCRRRVGARDGRPHAGPRGPARRRLRAAR